MAEHLRREEDDSELRVLAALSRALPRLRGAGRVAELLRAIYRRKERSPLEACVLGKRMRLDPREYVDSSLLFFPQLYDHREIAFMRREVRPGDVFLDAGANIGFYSLLASDWVGPTGRVVAIEADPYSHRILTENLRLNGVRNVDARLEGLSDREETLRLGVNLGGNRGSSSFLADDQREGVQVRCRPLTSLVRDLGVERIHFAKFDIEGFGGRVLREYLADLPDARLPVGMIVEKEDGVAELLSGRGYRVATESSFNWVWARPR